MSKGQRITIVVIAIVSVFACAGMGLLRWGGAVYQHSDGERGWRLGESIYQTLGWGAQAYQADFGWDDDEGCGADCAAVEGSVTHHRRFGPGFVRHRDRGGHIFFAGGMGCLAFWVLLGLVGLGVVWFRRWREAHPSASVAEE